MIQGLMQALSTLNQGGGQGSGGTGSGSGGQGTASTASQATGGQPPAAPPQAAATASQGSGSGGAYSGLGYPQQGADQGATAQHPPLEDHHIAGYESDFIDHYKGLTGQTPPMSKDFVMDPFGNYRPVLSYTLDGHHYVPARDGKEVLDNADTASRLVPGAPDQYKVNQSTGGNAGGGKGSEASDRLQRAGQAAAMIQSLMGGAAGNAESGPAGEAVGAAVGGAAGAAQAAQGAGGQTAGAQPPAAAVPAGPVPGGPTPTAGTNGAPAAGEAPAAGGKPGLGGLGAIWQQMLGQSGTTPEASDGTGGAGTGAGAAAAGAAPLSAQLLQQATEQSGQALTGIQKSGALATQAANVPVAGSKAPPLARLLPILAIAAMAGRQGGEILSGATQGYLGQQQAQRGQKVAGLQAQSQEQGQEAGFHEGQATSLRGSAGQALTYEHDIASAQLAYQRAVKVAEVYSGGRFSIAQLNNGTKQIDEMLKDMGGRFTDANERANYMQMLKKESPEKFGWIPDEEIEATRGDLRPHEQLDLANAGKAQSAAHLDDAKAKDIMATEYARNRQMMDRGDLDEATAGLRQGQKDLDAQRAGLVGMQQKWYPATQAAKINQANAGAWKSYAQANNSYGAAGKASNRGVTSTAYFDARVHIDEAMDKADAYEQQLKSEYGLLQGRQQTITSDPTKASPGESDKIDAAMRANLAQQAGTKAMKSNLGKRQADIENMVTQSWNANKMLPPNVAAAHLQALVRAGKTKGSDAETYFRQHYGMALQEGQNWDGTGWGVNPVADEQNPAAGSQENGQGTGQ